MFILAVRLDGFSINDAVKLIPYSVIPEKIASKSNTINPVILKVFLKFYNDISLSKYFYLYLAFTDIFILWLKNWQNFKYFNN